MTDQPQTIVQTPFEPGFWGAASRLIERLAETEVSLLTVLLLFAAYGLRELVGIYFNRRTHK